MQAYLANSGLPRSSVIGKMWPVAIGLLILYVPTLLTMARELWVQDEYSHGPIILSVSAFLLWRARAELFGSDQNSSTVAGLGITAFGLLLYIIGRSQEILMLEIGSAPWVLAGVVVTTRGLSTLKKVWFSLFFMVFMIPLPGMIVETVTMPMKLGVSYVAETLLYNLGYPIARSGVILQIGQYKMFVADACAGLQTLLTLESLGLFYLAVVQHSSLARNLTLACLIIPISFTANVLRVIALTLITFHFGDAAGQGFLHGFAGIVLFVSALILIIAVDTALRTLFSRPVNMARPGG